MEGALRTDAVIDLPRLRVERITQKASGPFHRAHAAIDRPSLIYIPPPFREAALGCFGVPASHRSLMSFGAAIFVPAHVPIHIQSPGFADRTMLVLRFDDLTTTGPAAGPTCANQEVLFRCFDVRGRRILETVERISQEVQSYAAGRDVILSGLALVLTGEMIRYLDEASLNSVNQRGALADWQMRRIAARLANETLPPPCIDDLATICGLGRRHFMRAFKAKTGLTAMEWVEHATFERATILLESGTMPVKAISAALGYSHPGCFTAAFARRFGLSPRKWRSRHALLGCMKELPAH